MESFTELIIILFIGTTEFKEMSAVAISYQNLVKQDIQAAHVFNDFGLAVWRKIYDTLKGNVMVSPINLAPLMAMLISGSSGENLAELASGSGFNKIQDEKTCGHALRGIIEGLTKSAKSGGSTFSSSTSLWSRADVLESYKKTLVTEFGAAQFPLTTHTAVNDFIKDQTQGHITDLLEPFTGDEVLVLVSALYYSGEWRHKFDKDLTQDRVFTLGSGLKVQVPTMHWQSEDTLFNCYRDSNISMVTMPQGKNEKFRLSFILPESADKLSDVVTNVTSEQYTKYLKSSTPQFVDLLVPKFQLIETQDVIPAFKKLGIVSVFCTGPNKWDRTIKDNPNISISQITHAVMLQVDEDGAKVAAASVAVEVEEDCCEVSYFHMNCNRPFIVVLDEVKTGAIVCVAVITNPDPSIQVDDSASGQQLMSDLESENLYVPPSGSSGSGFSLFD